MKCSVSNAAVVADWSFSSFDTSPRQKSEEIVSNGAKWVRAKVLLPQPDGPMSTTSDSSGSFRILRACITTSSRSGSAIRLPAREDPHLRRRPYLRVHRPHRCEPHRVAESSGDGP